MDSSVNSSSSHDSFTLCLYFHALLYSLKLMFIVIEILTMVETTQWKHGQIITFLIF